MKTPDLIGYEPNESNHMDMIGWLDTLEDLGVNIAKEFPAVHSANERVDRLLNIRAQHANAATDINIAARKIGIADDLDDTDAVLTYADHYAYADNPDHRARVSVLLTRAADFARGDALRRFRRAPILDIMRPAFDTLAHRIVTAAATIPQGVMNVGDAARLGHSDAYLQLERDIAQWKDTADLIGALHDAGVLVADRPERWPAEFMIDNLDAHREASGSIDHPMRRAAGIAAGVPNLHIPTEGEVIPAAPLGSAEDTKTMWAAADANAADKAAREDLGLVSR